MNKNKENAFTDFMDMIVNSWTWHRLTSHEQDLCEEALRDTHLFGTWKQRWQQLHDVYGAFLFALDYKPIGWRETDPDVPRF